MHLKKYSGTQLTGCLWMASCLLLSSCYKNYTEPLETTPPEYRIMMSSTYTAPIDLRYTTDTVVVNKGGTTDFIFGFERESGNPSNFPIFFELGPLPVGVSCTRKTDSFQLDYGLTTTLQVGADTGFYKINVNITDSKHGAKTYKCMLHVVPVDNCAICLNGIWHCTDSSNSSHYNATITAMTDTPGLVHISNFNNLGPGTIVKANISCLLDITIPLQTSNGYTVWGAAHNNTSFCGFTLLIFNIPYTIVHNGDTTIGSTSYKNW